MKPKELEIGSQLSIKFELNFSATLSWRGGREALKMTLLLKAITGFLSFVSATLSAASLRKQKPMIFSSACFYKLK